ncbi:MAG TPA: phosphoglycerate dehydrogenase, partial [Firmicutes bacterium]|nr:phosphoglycerate dehydrogenase [Bacillota bacterium]
VELYNKVLGVIALGRVGSEVVKRAKAMGMDILGFDPYISRERAEKIGAQLTTLEDICQKADFITLHLPKTKASYHMIGEKELALMKPNARIVNCARGGIIDEEALFNALSEGRIAGAALDVFEEEPAVDNPLFNLDNVIVTPHLGASTREAQVNVAVQVAHQVVAALKGEPVVTAVNVPAIPPETISNVKPFMPLMEKMGKFYMQVFDGQVETIELGYYGEIANYPVNPLTTNCLIGILSVMLNASVNYVNAPHIASQRGIKVKEVSSKDVENFTNLVTMKVETAKGTKVLSGTVFNQNDIRIVQIDQYRIDVVPSKYMLVCSYIDQPGVIGRVGTTLGNNNVNIAGMQVGRKSIGGEAVMVLQVDNMISDKLIEKILKLDAIISASFVKL